jgi:hypothetical protein
MIFVETAGGDEEFADATRFSTDEHNNLQLWDGPEAERLVQVFARGHWKSAGVDDESSD